MVVVVVGLVVVGVLLLSTMKHPCSCLPRPPLQYDEEIGRLAREAEAAGEVVRYVGQVRAACRKHIPGQDGR